MSDVYLSLEGKDFQKKFETGIKEANATWGEEDNKSRSALFPDLTLQSMA